MRNLHIVESKLVTVLAFAVVYFLPSPHSIADEEFPPTNRQEFGIGREISGQITAASGEGILLPASVRVHSISGSVYKPYRNNLAPEPGQLCDASNEYQILAKDAKKLLFVSQGFAPLSIPMPEGNRLDVELYQGRTISGKILSPLGEPVVGAEIKLVNWLIPRDPEKYRQGGKRYGGDRNIYANLPDHGESTKVLTDSKGIFELKNVPKQFRVALLVSAAGLSPRTVFVRADMDGVVDQRASDFPDQVLVENEFEMQLEKSSVLKVTALDDETGQPAKIRAISIDAVSRVNNPEYSRIRHEIDGTSATVNLNDYPKGFVAWIEPVDNDRLTGSRITFPANSKGELVESEVRFKKGKTMRGVVRDEQTKNFIPGVTLVWRTEDMGQWDEEGNFAPLDLTTDSEGLFEFAVPAQDGVLGIVGEVQGYQSDYGWNRQKEYEVFAPEILDRFTREISGDDDAEAQFEFWLLPSYRLNITTVSETGDPIAGCTVFAKIYKPNVFRTSALGESVSTTTDSEGRGTFSHWYQDAYQLKRAQEIEAGESDTIGQIRRGGFRPPNRLTAFSDGGILQGSGTVPLPDPDAETNEIEVSITIRTTGNIVGRIEDEAGEPVEEIWIQAFANNRYGSQAGLGWWTTTREDGRFRLENIPVDIPLKWRVDSTKVRTRKGQGTIKVDASELRSGETLKVPTIVVMDLSSLSQPLAEIDLDNLEDDEALLALQSYASENLAKVPKTGFDGRPFGNSSNNNPESRFVAKLATKLESLVIELADRDPGGEYELRVLAAASSWFHDPRSTGFGYLSYGNSLNFALHPRLLKNHVENEIAQDALLRFTHEISRHEHEDQGKRWRSLREKSPFNKTKAAASVRLFSIDAQKALGHSSPKNSDEEFDKHFAQLQKAVDAILAGSSELDDLSTAALSFLIKHVASQTETRLKQAKQSNEQKYVKRLERITKLIKPLSKKKKL